MELEVAWSELSGGPVGLATGDPSLARDFPDPRLEEELSFLRERFPDPIFRARFLEVSDDGDRGFRNAGRARQWAESRRCFARAIRAVLDQGISPERVQASLSHTSDACIAVSSAGAGLLGAGVDLERADRRISEAAAKRFFHESERQLGLTPLDVWVVKEACFKADPDNGHRVVADYRISPGGIAHLASSLRPEPGGVRFHYRLLAWRQHRVAMAVARPV